MTDIASVLREIANRHQDLTDRQAEVVEAILYHQAEHGSPPTFRELIKRLGITSPNGINYHLEALERKGVLLPRDKMLSRGLRLAGVRWMPVGEGR